MTTSIAAAPSARSWAQGQDLAVDEGGFVSINGVEQWIGLRGYDARNRVMLFLHGGPGLGVTHGSPVFADWERTFTIAYWDQPGGGATFAHNLGKDIGPLTIDRYVRDGIAVAEDVRRRMKVRKIVLFGISWGSRIGLIMIKRRPDLFSAYVGTAQVVSGPRGGLLGYNLALEAARKRGAQVPVDNLIKVGPPPYKTYEDLLIRGYYVTTPGQPPSARETAALAEQAKLMAASPIRPARSVPRDLPAYDVSQAYLATQKATFAESWAWDASSLGRDFKVPVFVFQGDADWNTPTALAKEFMDEIRAPRKAYVEIPGASHNTMPFHAELLALMKTHVLPVVRR